MAEEPNEEVFIEDNSITLEDTDNSEIVDEKISGIIPFIQERYQRAED